ncbi:hypothetical protein Nepgr_016385 [Nepenthes gracilis]|uniref:Amino acid transporter n=1 Tax=Nepenthes gracilis TaxID=150966 RepID=A0AAD3SPN0_NEPGR|nr:hypothetical protein Nepgr_016385 [Nepenthes gracilis]
MLLLLFSAMINLVMLGPGGFGCTANAAFLVLLLVDDVGRMINVTGETKTVLNVCSVAGSLDMQMASVGSSHKSHATLVDLLGKNPDGAKSAVMLAGVAVPRVLVP